MKSKIKGPRSEGGTLVCFAVKEEAQFFRQIGDRRGSVEILLTGIGRRNA
jgi:hypothetical protein